MPYKFNPFTGTLDAAGGDATTSLLNLKGTVANEAALPSSGNTIGDVWQAEDTGEFFVWDGTGWDGLGDFGASTGDPSGSPEFELLLSDVANTSGDVIGSTADTGQVWTASGDGTLSGKKPVYGSDENGGFMRASDLGGSVNTYIFGNLGNANCTRLRIRHKGSSATLAILKTPGSLNDMVHVNFTQSTGEPFARYWKTGVGADQAFGSNLLTSNPSADPNALRTYEIQIIGNYICCYTDEVLVGVVYDKVIPTIIGPGFFGQLHDANRRIYEFQAWTSEALTLSGGLSAAFVETELTQTRGLHVGRTTSANYNPTGDFYALSSSPTIQSDAASLNVTLRATGAGQGATLNLFNSSNQGFAVVAGGDFVTRLRHQGGDRILFPANTSRTDFPIPIGLAVRSTDPTGTAITDGALFYSSVTGRLRARVAGAFRELATVDGWTQVIGAPTAKDSSGLATTAELLAGVLTSDASPSTPVAITLPTGTNMDAGFNVLSANIAFQWSVINLDGAEAVTLQANTGHTLVGELTVAANKSGRWASRRTDANTWISYRIA
jgi:hypothetical protein